jgi:Binding-protein-dependent transport system inner membrane component
VWTGETGSAACSMSITDKLRDGVSAPDELLRAAKVDGASGWQRFTQVILPLMKPAILVALLFRTLDAFRCCLIIKRDRHHEIRRRARHPPRSRRPGLGPMPCG